MLSTKARFCTTCKHTDTFTQRSFYTQTHRCFYTLVPLHSNAFTHMCFRTGMLFTQRSLYTQRPLRTNTLTQRYFYNNIFTQRRFFAQIILQRGAFTRKYFYRMSQREREREIHTSAFTERCLYTQCLSTGRGSDTGMVLNRDILMQRILLHTGPLTQRCFQHRDAFAHRRLHIEIRS